MRAARHDLEWDLAWIEYDRSVPAAPDTRLTEGFPPRSNRKAKRRVLPLLVALALPMPTSLLSEDGASRGIPREALFSFSPVEILLPPIDVAIARLAAESVSAHCWVQQLRPQGGDCAEPDAAR